MPARRPTPGAPRSQNLRQAGFCQSRRRDPVSRDEPVVEIDTDNVTHEIRAAVTGILSEIKVGDGGSVERGALLGTITEY